MEKETRERGKTVWRESASLILVVPSREHDQTGNVEANGFNYNLLLLKRSNRTAMALDQAVFPGGLLDRADEAVDWLTYFEQFGVTQQALKQLVIVNEQRPRILLPRGNGCYDRFFIKSSIWAREISLRITAIRETFEEVGVLLCRSRGELCDLTAAFACHKDDFDEKAHWQQVVHNDPSAFLRLCRQLDVVPDLWGLYEWSVWASPAPIRKGYETAFFMALLPKTPSLLLEELEVKECMWRTPAQFIYMHDQEELWFLPPQMYELARLLGVPSLDSLRMYCRYWAHSSRGSTMHMPVGYICSDGVVSVLPGDDFYLSDPRSLDTFISVDATVAEFRLRANRLHRCEKVGAPNIVVRLNFELPDGQLGPVTLAADKNKL